MRALRLRDRVGPRTLVRLFGVGVLGVALGGCFGTTGASVEQLKARATFDLQCPAPATEVVELDARTRGVRGCGKQLTYVELCDNRPDGWHCTWVINSPAWYVAPPRNPPGHEGAWWWTSPQGVEASPRGAAAPGPAPAPAPGAATPTPTQEAPKPQPIPTVTSAPMLPPPPPAPTHRVPAPPEPVPMGSPKPASTGDH